MSLIIKRLPSRASTLTIIINFSYSQTRRTFTSQARNGISQEKGSVKMASKEQQSVDLPLYLRRIGVDPKRKLEPNIETLNLIMSHHTRTIPFENLDVLLRRPINLDVESLQTKICKDHRGGYCFEQNMLVWHVLKAIGYKVTTHGGRVRWNVESRDVVPPRTHLFLKVWDLVTPGDEWMVDGGSAPSLCSAFPFIFDKEIETSHDVRRLVKDETGRMFMQLKIGPTTWKDSLEFTFDIMHPIDVEIANWFTSASPVSHFLNRLIVAKADHDGKRVYIIDGKFCVRKADGTFIENTPITSKHQLNALLRKHFELVFPEETVFGPAGSPWCE